MTPEAVALAERLVAVVGWKRLSGTVTNDGVLWRYERDDSEGVPVGTFTRVTVGVGYTVATHDEWETIDLDHPSNEGHLRRLAEEVCGAWVEKRATTTGPMWRVNAEGVLLDCLYPTPGQAYAAAIVAASEAK